MALRSDFETGTSTGQGAGNLNVLNSEEITSVEIPHGNFILHAEYARDGQDLVLTDEYGREVAVEGYFSHSPLPDLTNEAGARVEGAFVEKLAGPGQVAQSGNQAAALGEPVGAVETLEGVATVRHKDGTSEQLQLGDEIYQDDIIETSSNGNLGVLLKDGSIMGVGPGSRMTIDSFVYDSETNDGNVGLSFLKGAVSFVSGKIAKNDYEDVNIKVPFGTIGIRGTEFVVETGPDGLATVYVLEGRVLTISNGQQVILEPGDLASITTAGLTSIQQLPVVQIQELFKEVLRSQEGTRSIRDGRADNSEGELDAEPAAGGNQQADGTGNDSGEENPENSKSDREEDFALEEFDPNLTSSEVGNIDISVLFTGSSGSDPNFQEKGDLDTFEGAIAFFGSDGDDVFTGGGFGDFISGIGGNDSLSGAGGNDSVSGGEGNDTLNGDGGDDTVDGGVGNDVLQGGEGSVDILLGGEGDDLLYGDNADDPDPTTGDMDTLFGDGGNDTLYGGGGNDLMFGGSGNDELYGGYGSDELNGGAGHDVLLGGAGDDTLNGGSGNDVLQGGKGSVDSLSGGEGDDLLYGDDAVDLDPELGDLDTVSGDQGNDTLYGGGGADLLNGGEDDDLLFGGFGSDEILGGSGADTLSGDAGNDTLDGGEGIDTAFYAGSASSYEFSYKDGQIIVEDTATGDSDTLSNVERAKFSEEGDFSLVTFSISGDQDVVEGGVASFEISLSGTPLSPGETASVIVSLEGAGGDVGSLFDALSSAAAESSGVSVVALDEGVEVTFSGGLESASSLVFELAAHIDGEIESPESFDVKITPRNTDSSIAVVIDDTVSTTIEDLPPVEFYLGGADQIAEGAEGGFQIGYTGNIPEGGTASIQVAFSSGSTEEGDVESFYTALQAAADNVDGVSFDRETRVLEFSSGTTELAFSIGAINDTLTEGDESFSVTIADPISDVVYVSVDAANEAVTTRIIDNDAIGISLQGSTSVREGEAADYNIAIDGEIPAGETISVDVSILDGLENTASEDDYGSLVAALAAAASETSGVEANGTTLTFDSTVTEFSFSLATVSEDELEGSEDFVVTLSNAVVSNGGIANLDGEGAVTTSITEPPTDVAFSLIGDPSVSEGASASYTISYTGGIAFEETASVRVVLNEGNPEASADATDVENLIAALQEAVDATAGVTLDGDTLIFDSSSTSLSFSLGAVDDGLTEGPEGFSISLVDASASSGAARVVELDGTVVTEITDNDTLKVELTGDNSVREGSAAEYTINIIGEIPDGETVSVDVLDQIDTASSEDYQNLVAALNNAAAATTGVSVSGNTVTFDSTASSFTFSLGIIENDGEEGVETFAITLDSPEISNEGDVEITGSGTVSTTITEPSYIVFSISGDEAVIEGASASYTIGYTGMIEDGETASVRIAFNEGSATAEDLSTIVAALQSAADNTAGVSFDGVDLVTFDSTSGPLEFDLGIVDDGLTEGDETFSISLFGPIGSSGFVSVDPLAGSAGTQIDDIDSIQVEIVGDASVVEGGTATYSISLTGGVPSGETVSFEVRIQEGSTNSADISDYSSLVAALATAAASTPGVTSDGNTLTFDSTASALSFSLDISELDGVEGVEDFVVTLANPSVSNGGDIEMGPSGEVTTEILENFSVQVGFSETEVVREEGQTSRFNIELTATFGPGVATLPAGAEIVFSLAFLNIDTEAADFDGMLSDFMSSFPAGVEVTAEEEGILITVTDQAVFTNGDLVLPVDVISIGSDGIESSEEFALSIENVIGTGTGIEVVEGNLIAVGTLTDDGIVAITPTTEDDDLQGTADADLIDALSGDDRVAGGAGDDTLIGGQGRDRIEGDAGADSLVGGEGDDSLFGGEGTDTLIGGSGDDALDGGEGAGLLDGGSGNDTLTGGSAADTLLGGEGRDELRGLDGNDRLEGNEGDDTLIGGAGDDTLIGSNGADLLIGSEGDDILTGNGNIDIFAFIRLQDATQMTTNGIFSGTSDEITDFGNGKDLIQLAEEFEFVGEYNAFDDFLTTIDGQAYDGTNADYSGGQTEGEAKVIFDGTHLYYDANGNDDGYTVVAHISSGTVVGTDITTSNGGA
ncbi:hypothetical protein GUA87_07175 [Sneathiella sp. P13V-1]|uniref:Calx-beta domain-containing protein n=1 Tax=Sneathiella sp. P13V-1 TaxID=2697366 RepID=UPI00187B4BFA|nr:FecR domain-containing protein [Sneathiella sp. P13V-1]MBE7636623.1 hypothetical protein [Sneathiella sp. P13V-1]